MSKEKYKATHKLKKDFVYNDGKIFKKGSPVGIPRGYQGFRGNVFFLTPTGRLKSNRNHVLHLYSKIFFRPMRAWFEVI